VQVLDWMKNPVNATEYAKQRQKKVGGRWVQLRTCSALAFRHCLAAG
jgi:hypothetical protein